VKHAASEASTTTYMPDRPVPRDSALSYAGLVCVIKSSRNAVTRVTGQVWLEQHAQCASASELMSLCSFAAQLQQVQLPEQVPCKACTYSLACHSLKPKRPCSS
jgi:hypothetical protein